MKSLLIVDDDPNNQRMLSYTLRKVGYDVRVAANGQLALDALHQAPADLAIVDFAMPVMDGVTLLRHIRADEQFRSMQVVILTASADDVNRLVAEEEGANAFLTKPTSSRVILSLVKELLEI